MKHFLRGTLAALLAVYFLSAGPASAAGIQQAFLVQNSGWMEPFYTDPGSQFKPLVAAVAAATTTAEDQVFTLAFSQSSASNVSPVLLAKSQGVAEVAHQLASLSVARKGSGTAMADTDFNEAISKTITSHFKAAPGILWIFTNNKNSPNNDVQTAERNRDFYRLLYLEPAITKTLVFPLRMPVQGKIFAAKGLMVYALAYGASAADALDRIMAEGRLTAVLTDAPARLKPVDQDAVRIVPERVKNLSGVRASLGQDQRTLVLDVEASGLVPAVTLQASLENLLYPHVIQQAVVEATLLAGADRSPISVNPAVVQALKPGARQAVEVRFTLPMAQVPSAWSAQALSAMGKQVLLPMTVELGLTGQQLMLSDDFSAKLQEIFPGDPISEVFTPPDSVRASRVRVPLLVRIQYPLLPVLVLMAGLLTLVAGLTGLGMLSRSSKRYEMAVDGLTRQVLLKPFTRLVIQNGAGQTVGEIKRSFGKPQVIRVETGHSVMFTGR